MPRLEPATSRFSIWWHGVPALPTSSECHEYYALRRVWGDHTMAGARGFYNPRSEDHATVNLFQTFAAFSSLAWADGLLREVGLKTRQVTRARFAFACEELIDSTLRHRHGRDFVIADIMLHYENACGEGLLAFEVKKPGGPMPTVQDLTKAETYANLPSTRAIAARTACFLVDDRHVPALHRAGHRALGWGQVQALQRQALDAEELRGNVKRVLRAHLDAHFAALGVGSALQPPAPDLAAEFTKARTLCLPPAIEALACGFAICAARRAGRTVDQAPWPWLLDEPDADRLRAARRQTTAERRINRWSLEWSPAMETHWNLA